MRKKLLRYGNRIIPMILSMFKIIIKKFKIFYSIIVNNSVYMVNNFSRLKIPAKMFFHNNSMFHNISTLLTKWMSKRFNSYISFTVNNFPSFPLRVFRTSKSSHSSFFYSLYPYFRKLSSCIWSQFSNSRFMKTFRRTINSLSLIKCRWIDGKIDFAHFTNTINMRFGRSRHKNSFIIVSIILLLLLGVNTSFATGELTSYVKVKFLGLNSRVSPKLLSDDESPDCSNITLQETGAIQDRDTFGQYNSVPGALGNNPITGLFKFYGPVAKYFVCSTGSKLFSGSGGSWSDITNAGITPTQGSYWSACSGVSGDSIAFYLFNQSVPMQKWTGSGATTTPASYPGTNCSYGTIHKGRVWATGSAVVPYRLYFSSINSGDDWTTTGGFIDLPEESSVPTGIISYGGNLYILTEQNVWVLSGSTPTDFVLRKTVSSVGAVAPRSIKVTDLGMMFLARSGVFCFNGNTSVKVSDKIETTINNLATTYIQNACAVYDGQQRYWLSVCESPSTINNTILVYDITTLKEWYRYDNLYIGVMERAIGGTDKGELYGGSSSANGIVYKLQKASGTESITHSTKTDFNSQVTFNTVVNSDDHVSPIRDGAEFTQKYNNALLLHLNGLNNATTTEDLSVTNHTVTFNNNAKISTSQQKFGTASCYFDGTGDSLSVGAASSSDWAFGVEPFTMDLWVKFTTVKDCDFISAFAGAGNYFRFGFDSGATSYIYWYHVTGGNSNQQRAVWTPTANTWYHVCVTRSGLTDADWRIFVDGTQLTTTQIGVDPATAVGDFGVALSIGSGPIGDLDGYMDEIRIMRGKARWTSSFTKFSSEYKEMAASGTLHSQNLQINAAGLAALDRITWTENLGSGTKIAFDTRTGTTNDSVYFNSWQRWNASGSSVTFDTVTDGTAQFVSDNTTGLEVFHGDTEGKIRNVLYYEDEKTTSPNCVSFLTVGGLSQGDSAIGTIPIKDLSGVDWISGWLRAPSTGNSVEFSFGERVASENTTTINTVNINTWERWYYYIGAIPAASRNEVSQICVKYTGDAAGCVAYGGFEGYTFYNSGDLIASTPNDFIQYRAIFSTPSPNYIPQLYNVTLTYTPALLTDETTLSTYYYTKWIDFSTPQVDKQFLDFFMDCQEAISPCTVYVDYNIDDGIKTGTLSIPISTTANSVRVRKYFPSSTFGKTMRLKIYKDVTGAIIPKTTIRGIEIRYRTEGFN